MFKTKEEIKQSLKCCAIDRCCIGCAYFHEDVPADTPMHDCCDMRLMRDALKLIEEMEKN